MKLIRFSILSVFLFNLSFGASQGTISSPTLDGFRGHMRTYSAQTLGNGKLLMGLSIEGSNDKNKLVNQQFEDRSDPDNVLPIKVAEVMNLTSRAFIAVGVSNYIDLGISLPYYIDNLTKESELPGLLESAKGAGVGDLEIKGKLQYPPYEHSHIFDMAFMGSLTFPTGDTEKGIIPKENYFIPKNDASNTLFYSSKEITYSLLMLWTLDLNHLRDPMPFMWNINYGIRATKNDSLDNQFLLNSSVAFTPNEHFSFFVDFAGEARMEQLENGFKLGEDPLYISPGLEIKTQSGVTFKVAFDFGLSSDLDTADLDPLRISNRDSIYTYWAQPTAKYGFSALLSWAGFVVPQDADKDGILDKEDHCKTEREDFDGYEDYDGCPEPDNDSDFILDAKDNCPNDAEDKDGFEDEDGCPDVDNDKDGYIDTKDKCPDQAEDMNGYEDHDGCPDGDKDGDLDGVPDIKDLCPTKKEDIDGFEDEDGCPDEDNDQDGIPDVKDKCPLVKEVYNKFKDEDGCADTKPRPIIEKKSKIILKGVNFATGSAKLTNDSYDDLEEIADQIIANPGALIEIRGYTDSRGSRRGNIKLSKRRAKAVMDALIDMGVKRSQLRYKGFGPKSPIATNKTASGRAKNRRIEMYRVK